MDELRAKCGTLCNECAFRERFGCKGCTAMNGKPFWGECHLYRCTSEKGHVHCGQCAQLPCEALLGAIANGHQPNRLEHLMQWKNEEV